MKRKVIYSGLAAGVLAASGLAILVPEASAMQATAHTTKQIAPTVRACAAVAKPGQATCFAVGLARPDGKLLVLHSPLAAPFASGFTPTDIQKAYNLTGLKSGGRTVAIVDAYGYPGLESDLATFRSNYGLPACTTSNGCLKIEGQTGGAPPGTIDSGWDVEQALDVDAVSSACPDCKILVVEGNGAQWSDLEAAENTAAATSGVVAISNSYGGSTSQSSAYNHPGIAVVASSGDSGFDGGQYPAKDPNVVGVGGTSVTRTGGSRGYSEAVWPGAGSGCGSLSQPAWQKKAKTTCNTKAVSDVSAAADPNLGGLLIFCGTVSGCGGWAQYGGTSEASPIIGAVYGLSGKTKGYPAKTLYKKKKAKKGLFDVTTGSNGGCGVPVCTARKGWDGPTGMGTPNGIKAF